MTRASAPLTPEATGVDDLDFYIGDEAIANEHVYALQSPIRHGVVEDWDLMERFWEQCIFKYLRADPEDHYMLVVSGWRGAAARCSRTALTGRASADGAAAESAGEPRVHGRDHV